MEHSIETMENAILNILEANEPSIYLFGSVVLNDFQPGWSDIDILCLVHNKIENDQALKLVSLRQNLLEKEQSNPYYRCFEGGFLSLDAFKNNASDTVVYWGTSGQQITENYIFDPFSLMVLLDKGRLLYGKEIRNQLNYPTAEEVRKAVEHYYHIIRNNSSRTGSSLYSAGWLFDIARCIHTLRTGKVIAKTEAGAWALEEEIVPDPEVMRRALEIRKHPLKYKKD